jgi:hypothetical protein
MYAVWCIYMQHKSSGVYIQHKVLWCYVYRAETDPWRAAVGLMVLRGLAEEVQAGFGAGARDTVMPG